VPFFVLSKVLWRQGQHTFIFYAYLLFSPAILTAMTPPPQACARPLVQGIPSTGMLRVNDRRSMVISQARPKLSPLKLYAEGSLVFGYAVIAMAVLPYCLQILFPKLLNNFFFMAVYRQDKPDEVQKAEIGWKTRYSTLAFALTTLNVFEVLVVPPEILTPAKVLRDSYFIWIIYYLEATRKIRAECKQGLLAKNRLSSQVWHLTVVALLAVTLLAKEGNIFNTIINTIVSSRIAQALPITWLFKKIGLAS
jgi:hypothetical protein